MSVPVLADIGAQWFTNNHLIQAPSSGGTFQQNGMAYGLAVVGAGTYVLPDNGHPQYVRATGAVTITSVAAVTAATLVSGELALFIPSSTTTWICAWQSGVYDHLTSAKGMIDIPLPSWREAGTDDTLNAAGHGGILATDTTPALEYTNGDTDSTLRLLWAVSNSDPIVTQFSIPWDMDRTQPLLFKAIGLMGSTENTPVLALDTYFKAEGTAATAKIEDNSTAFSDAEAAVVATIAAADFPAVAATVPMSCTVEVTPGAHTTASNTITVYQTWFEYTKKLVY